MIPYQMDHQVKFMMTIHIIMTRMITYKQLLMINHTLTRQMMPIIIITAKLFLSNLP
jgi:hypothetical protein